jgi:hypothetical protein
VVLDCPIALPTSLVTLKISVTPAVKFGSPTAKRLDDVVDFHSRDGAYKFYAASGKDLLQTSGNAVADLKAEGRTQKEELRSVKPEPSRGGSGKKREASYFRGARRLPAAAGKLRGAIR